MAEYSIDDLVDHILSDDVVNASKIMNELMVDKINDTVELRKIDIVNQMFNGGSPEENDEEVELDDEEEIEEDLELEDEDE